MLILITQIFAVSATSNEEWTRQYVGTNKERAEALIQCSDGGYLIAGQTDNIDSGRRQLWLLKTDAQGNAEWNKTYGTAGSASTSCVIQTSDGGYVLAGTVNSAAEVIKTDAAGNMEWNRTFEKNTDANWIIKTSDDGYALAGTLRTNVMKGNVIYDFSDTFWLVKLDASGGTSWSKTYPEAEAGAASAVVEAKDGGYAMVGTTENMDFLLVKIDTQGGFEWSKPYSKPDKDSGQSILQDPDGCYVMSGLMWNRSIGGGGIGLVKTNSAGDLLWMKNFPVSGWTSSMVRGNDDSYILCSGMLDNIDREGNLLWSQNISKDATSDQAYAAATDLVAQTSDGGYVVAGTIQTSPTDSEDVTSYVWLGKIDAEGNPATFIPEFPAVAVVGFAVWVCLVAVVFKKHGKPQTPNNNSCICSLRITQTL